jgi:ATP-dependent Clp protease protease subunit
MTIKKLPKIENFEVPESFERGIPHAALTAWAPGLDVANLAGDGETVIEIYDVIGGDSFFGGVNSRYVANVLRGAKDVVVNINSPGGSFMEGNAIYNLLQAHPGKVTINVIGWAASAASIIMMAGDVRNIAPSAFVMIHNGQAGVEGDRHDLAEVIKLLEKIDDALAGIYVAATGAGKRKIVEMLDNETSMDAKTAVELGFADAILDPAKVTTASSPQVRNHAQGVRADRLMDEALRAQFPSLTRNDRIDLRNAIREGKPGAVFTPTRDAGLSDIAADIRKLAASITEKQG